MAYTKVSFPKPGKSFETNSPNLPPPVAIILLRYFSTLSTLKAICPIPVLFISGETSLISAYLAGVDRAIISEVPFDPEKLAILLNGDKKNNPSNYAIMTISEGARIIGGKIVER